MKQKFMTKKRQNMAKVEKGKGGKNSKIYVDTLH